MNLKIALLAGAVASAIAFGAPSANAATATTSMNVSLTIQDACDVTSVAPTDLDFGTHGPLTSKIDQSSTITVTCTTGAPYNIGLDGGSSGKVDARTLVNGSDAVNYQLYSDANRTSVWGNTVGTDTLASVGTGQSQAFPVYGRVPAQATPKAGLYADTVQVTVTY